MSAVTSSPGTAERERRSAVGSLLDDFTVTGFSITCAWHFLVLFSAMPLTGSDAVLGRQTSFQLALYLSLALSYVVLIVTTNSFARALNKRGASSWRRANIAFGVFASASTLFVVLASGKGFYVELASWICLGVSESFLMYPWLQLPIMGKTEMNSPVNYAFNMGIGGIAAFIIGNLISPYNCIALCLLPLLASLSLVPTWNTAIIPEKDEHLVVPFQMKVLENSHFIFYGIGFGLCQAVFSAESTESFGFINFIATDSWPLCGVMLSAVIIVLASSRGLRNGQVITIQHLSSLLFIAGIMGSLYFVSSQSMLSGEGFRLGLLGSEIVCLAGFNAFDFGFMIFAFFKASKFKSGFANFICFNRATLYLSMSVGVVLGIGVHMLLEPVLPNAMTLAVGLVIVLLSTSMIPFFDRYIPIDVAEPASGSNKPEEQSTAEALEEEADNQEEKLAETLEKMAEEHGLSKREREVFVFLAQEKSASEIQQEFGISIHTVKTHMSSVYRKLEVHSARELIALVDSECDKAAGNDGDTKPYEIKEES